MIKKGFVLIETLRGARSVGKQLLPFAIYEVSKRDAAELCLSNKARPFDPDANAALVEKKIELAGPLLPREEKMEKLIPVKRRSDK